MCYYQQQKSKSCFCSSHTLVSKKDPDSFYLVALHVLSVSAKYIFHLSHICHLSSIFHLFTYMNISPHTAFQLIQTKSFYWEKICLFLSLLTKNTFSTFHHDMSIYCASSKCMDKGTPSSAQSKLLQHCLTKDFPLIFTCWCELRSESQYEV